MLIFVVQPLLGLQGTFRCVLEEDGSEMVPDVLEAIIDANEKIGLVMVLLDGEQWSPDEIVDHCFVRQHFNGRMLSKFLNRIDEKLFLLPLR
jgi:hypothetical protein